MVEPTQLGLWPQQPRRRPLGSAPIAAAGDPVSSHLAAHDISASGLRTQRKQEVLLFLADCSEPVTSAELGAAMGIERHEAARRLPDLAADGLVERAPMRVCRQTHRLCITWRSTEARP